MKYSQKNKFALITGASGLLGQYHAEALAEIGYNLILIDINLKKLTRLKEKLIKKYKKTKFYSYNCDITSEEQVLILRNKLANKNLFISCLVNNADNNPKMNSSKNSKNSKIENYKLEELKNEISVGILGTFNCSKFFGYKMAKKNSGIIINI